MGQGPHGFRISGGLRKRRSRAAIRKYPPHPHAEPWGRGPMDSRKEQHMEQNQTLSAACYHSLQQVLINAFNIRTLIFTPPYADFKEIDLGMRAAIWSDYNAQETASFFSESDPANRLLIIKSNLGFYNIIATLTGGKRPEFFTIGPFRDNELSAGYFTQIVKETQIRPSEIHRIKYLYERMPLARPDAVINVTKNILEIYFPAFADITPQFLQFAEQKRLSSVNTQLLDDYSVEYSERYRQALLTLTSSFSAGDYQQMRAAMKQFLQESFLLKPQNLREYKATLHQLNDYCHLALLQTSIHPLHILKLAGSVRVRIDEETSLSKLEQIPNEICHKYHLLVKNYAHSECSRLTKDVIDYINLHLEDELSLHQLADHFGKNAAALSHSFSREIGTSLTTYIQQTRVQAALKLFHTTDMSVSEVATAVGYQDFSYFSKVFSRHVGCSPRAYRNGRIQDQPLPDDLD